MPTTGLHVQQDGKVQEYSALVGASFAYQTVDDSDGTGHDSDATYLTITRQSPRVSFPLFLQAEGLLPLSITLNVGARGSGTHPRIRVGFYRSGLSGFSASLYTTTSGWTVAQTTFSTNPITGGPWAPSDLIGLEPLVQNETGINGANDVTLLSGSLTYVPMTNARIVMPWTQPVM